MKHIYKVESRFKKHVDPNDPSKYLVGEYKDGQIIVHPYSEKFAWFFEFVDSWDDIVSDDYDLPYLIYAENQLLTQ